VWVVGEGGKEDQPKLLSAYTLSISRGKERVGPGEAKSGVGKYREKNCQTRAENQAYNVSFRTAFVAKKGLTRPGREGEWRNVWRGTVMPAREAMSGGGCRREKRGNKRE